MPILLDFESRSRADLKKVGGRKYWEHPSTEALCCVLHDTDSGEVEVWERGQPPPELARVGCYGFQYAAHNAVGFDRFAAERLGWSAPDHDWIDTAELARAAGLPGALDALGTRWIGLPKDKAASKFTKGLSSVRRPAKGPGAITATDWNSYTPEAKRARGLQPEITPEVMARVVAYCISDVEILAHGWEILETWQGIEPEVSRVDRAVNNRGVAFDSQLARRLLECDAHNAAQVLDRVGVALGLGAERVREIANSNIQFPDFTGIANAQAETIAEALAGTWLSLDARAMCEARGALASITAGKLEAGLARVSADGRLRDMHRYLGGHTWRWSGSGIQLQNIPRPAARFEEWGDAEICSLVERTLAGYWADQDEIDLMLRACIFARPGHTLIVEDFSGVEARGLAWAAGDHKGIKTLLSKDVYKVNASQIFGVPYESVTKPQRQAGKVGELACGYQGGAGAIVRFASKMGINLAAANVDPQEIVDAWRALHPAVVRFWNDCERAMTKAINGTEAHAGPFAFIPSSDGRDVAAIMPNGRPLVYNETKISRDHKGRPRITYQGREAWREDLYGGKIVENLIQSGCRELLAEALVTCDRGGLDPVLHVHDEIVGEVPISAEAEAREYLHDVMTHVPDWAEGFPLGAAGHSGTRYRK